MQGKASLRGRRTRNASKCSPSATKWCDFPLIFDSQSQFSLFVYLARIEKFDSCQILIKVHFIFGPLLIFC